MKDNKYVILYVDDDQDMLDSLRIVLEAKSYTMEEANSAEDGVRRYKEVNPDLVIVDLMMEEVDAGMQFVKELRLLNNTKPVFMLSSVGDSFSMSADYSELGLDGVLQKPVDQEELMALLKAKL